MSKVKNLQLIIALLAITTSCTSVLDSEMVEIAKTRSIDSPIIIYDESNWPDFSERIAFVKSVSVEEQSIDRPMNRLSYATYGPWGGSGGDAFYAPMLLDIGESSKKMYAIKIRSGSMIDAIQIYWVSDTGSYTNSGHFGGSGGNEHWIFLAEGEYIKKIQVNNGSKIDKLIFTTSLNKVYTLGGSGGDYQNIVDFGISNMQMHGIFGRSGSKLDKLGVYCYPNSLFE